MRSRCVTLGKGVSPRCDNLLHFPCLTTLGSAYSRKWQKDAWSPFFLSTMMWSFARCSATTWGGMTTR